MKQQQKEIRQCHLDWDGVRAMMSFSFSHKHPLAKIKVDINKPCESLFLYIYRVLLEAHVLDLLLVLFFYSLVHTSSTVCWTFS